MKPLPRFLIRHLPFFYGWVVLPAPAAPASRAQGGAVATLSIFVEPMTREFGWSRTALSGAVSLGGVLAAVSSPALGRMLDRRGARLVLCLAVLLTGTADMLLSLTGSLLMFYLLFCIARMNFAGPFDLGIYGAVNNWFIARRALATSIATLAQMAGLVALPLIAQAAILRDGWRAGWVAVGIAVLVIGFIPNWLLMVRRPEDVGLAPDRGPARNPVEVTNRVAEPSFTRAAGVADSSFWLLCLFTLFAYPVQAGVSLHQAPFLIERGLARRLQRPLSAPSRSCRAWPASASASSRAPCRSVTRSPSPGSRSPSGHSAMLGIEFAAPRLSRRGNVRRRHRRTAYAAADRLGRLLRAAQLWRDPRHRTVRAGAGAGIGPAPVGHPARLVGQL